MGGCLDKYISVVTWPPKQKFLAPPLVKRKTPLDVKSYLCKQNVNLEFKKSKQYLERKKKKKNCIKYKQGEHLHQQPH